MNSDYVHGAVLHARAVDGAEIRNGCEVDRVVGSERQEDPVRTAILLIPLALVACEGSGSTSASSVVTLQPGGANPTAISVMGGAQLEFVNADSMDIKSPRAIARS